MRGRTTDRTVDRSEVFTTKRLGRTQELTPEGFLLCRGVAIARVGEMLYAAGEIADDGGEPLEAAPDGLIRVTRGPEELFRPETLASFNGKAVTLDHPDEDVNPENFAALAKGVVLNVRQGEGEDEGCMVADLLIHDQAAIAYVREELPEVSNGYDADYEQTEPGKARQFNIIGNHVALVDQGRCGPRCAIGDADMKTRDTKKRTWMDRVMTAFKARDEAALTEALEQAQDEMTEGTAATGSDPQTLVIKLEGPTPAAAVETTTDDEGGAEGEAAPAWFTAHVEQNNARFGKIEEALSKLGGGGTNDEASDEDDNDRTDDADGDDGDDDDKTKDEAAEGDDDDKADKTKDRRTVRDAAGLAGERKDLVVRAEILVPGFKVPTYDAKDPAKRTRDRMCATRRRVLAKAYEDEDTRDIMAPLFGGKKPDFASLTCDGAKMMFTAASELVKSANTAITTSGFVHDHEATGAPQSISDINQRNREFWKGKGGLN